MSETSKRRYRENDWEKNNHKRRVNEKGERTNDELVVYRILCPDGIIGSVIGKSGKVINSIRQETRAKVKVVDPFPGAKVRVITTYCYVKEREKVDVDNDYNDTKPLCPAQDALLKVHDAISNALMLTTEFENKKKDKVECQILVPASQSANIIGKSGATIKRLRSQTRANIRVVAKEASDPAHSCAMEFDNFIMITGDSEQVRMALYAISAIMYKFTPKEEIPLDTTVAEALPSIIIPSDIPIFPTSGFYPSIDSMAPSRSVPPILSSSSVPDLPVYGESGSRWSVYSSGIPIISGFGASTRSEDLVVRVLCPFGNIGRVIGKGGSSINTVRQESGARIEVNDAKADLEDCIITVMSTESPDDIKSKAVEAVLLLLGKINDEDDGTVTIKLLVPSKAIGCLIGKNGSIINEIRKRTKAQVRISKRSKQKSGDGNDELVEVTGNVANVRDALVQIVLRLRADVLAKDRDGGHNPAVGSESIYSRESDLSMPALLHSIPPVAPLHNHGAESGSTLGLLPSSSLHGGYGSLPMGENDYGSMSPYSSNHYIGFPKPSTLEMLIPAHAIGKVMGKGGTNISNIRKISGAVVEISDPKSARGDRMALISGTSEQKRSAENLIQAFIMAT